jgi:hypothetical protein
MNAELRELAGRLDMLQDCICLGKPITIYEDDKPLVQFPCVLKCGDGRRLPTEAEVREAIFEASVTWVETGWSRAFAYVMFGGDDEYRSEAHAEEAEADDLVLLALLRALEAARRG